MTNATAASRIENLPAAIKATKADLKDILRKNAENGEEWNDQRCIDAHQGQIKQYKKELKEARGVLA
tara:strand:- start:606 stop:806 length:201 start_codon:yes stop_codon:yes gene_type:complete